MASSVNKPEPVFICSGTHPLTKRAADSTTSLGAESGVVTNSVTPCRSKCSRDSDPLLRNVDAASDQVNYDISDERCSSEVSSKCDCQSMSYDLVNASPAGVFEVRSVRKNLPAEASNPIPISDFLDPRSLRETDLSTLVEQVETVSVTDKSRLLGCLPC